MDSALFIGRFQPFHNGHLSVIKDILKKHERAIIVVGSAEKNFLPSNPLTAGERFELIDESLKAEGIPCENYCIIPVRNVNNYALWVNHINIHVPPYSHIYTGSKIVKACYEGKYFQNHRPSNNHLNIIQVEKKLDISASTVRDKILTDDNWQEMVPDAVVKKFEEWDFPTRLKTIKDTMDITKYNNSY